MMKNVFLVKSPLQLLNAIEAKHHFGLKDEDCVLIVMGDKRNQPNMLRLINSRPLWGDVILLHTVGLFLDDPFYNRSESSWRGKIWGLGIFKKSIFNIRRLNKISKSLGKAGFVFIGFSRDVYMRHFVNSTPHKEVVLLDDGNATLEIAKDRKRNLDTSTKKMPAYRKFKLHVKRFLQGVKDYEVDRLTFFSAYDLDLGKKDSLVKNNFNYIRNESRSVGKDDAVYFIGAPLDEVGLILRDQYIAYLMKVKEYFKNRKIVYVAHHREKKDKLNKLRDVLGFDIVLFDYLIEYQVAVLGPRPAVLASFFSSALENCRLIFGNEMKIISFRIGLEACPTRDRIEPIYDYYMDKMDEDFRVVSLDKL
jgi:hypothetical protein